MDFPTNDELESFLKKIDEIEAVVKGLNSEDQQKVKENLSKADGLIQKDDEIEENGIKTKIGKSRSVINKYTNEDLNGPDPALMNRNLSQDAFMSIMERDANERFERKKLNTKLANELKEKGNQEFQAKNYEKAIELYTEALQKVKDISSIYTNRAQAYINIGKYTEAISDCDWALRINEKFTKAFIHKGKALAYMKEFDKAFEVFENAKLTDPKQSSVIDEYVKEVERLRLAYNQEKSTEIFLAKDKNDSVNNFLEILEKKINLEKQDLYYYSGGLRCLASLCDDETKKTLFRTKNGFKLLHEHLILNKYLNEFVVLNELNMNELDLLCSYFELLQIVCNQCDENVRTLFKLEKFSNIIENYLNCYKTMNSNKFIELKCQNFKFLLSLTENEFGIIQLINNFNQSILLKFLVNLISNENDLTVKELTINIIQNLTLEKKYHSKLSNENVKYLTEDLTNILKEQPELTNKTKKFIKHLITSIYALTIDKTFLKVISTNELIWIELIKLMQNISINKKENFESLTNVIICLLVNLCATKSELLSNNSEKIVENVLKIASNQNAEVLSLIGNILQNITDKENIFKLFDKSLIESLIENIKTKNVLSQSVKLMAICLQNESNKFRQQIVEVDKNLDFLYEIFKNVSKTTVDQDPSQENNINNKLNLKKFNEAIINNSVLCISYCVESDLKLVKRLVKTNIMMDLLYLTRDGFNLEMRKNCGVLIAKLSKKDENHLNRLRELNGIEILYASLKNANI